MPDRMIDLFMRICRENGGTVYLNKRKSLFDKLTDEEVAALEVCVRKAFGMDSNGSSAEQKGTESVRP